MDNYSTSFTNKYKKHGYQCEKIVKINIEILLKTIEKNMNK